MLLRLVIPLLASGVALCSHSNQEYYLISTAKSWDNAQKYCRQSYTDLATVQDTHDVSRLTDLNVAKKSCWIGLYKTSVASWAWSLEGDSSSLAHFTNWDPSLASKHSCGAMRADGKWQTSTCSAQLPFVCQSDGAGGTFALLTEAKTWSGAQAYCRLHGTDLASARSPAENEAARQLIGRHEEESHPLFWIGLFKSKVRWSDGGYSSFKNWYATQPNQDGECVLADKNGKWFDRGCKSLLCFYCYARKSIKFIMRLQFKSKSKISSFRDSALTDDILSKIQNKLDKVKLEWRAQPDGKVFHKRD